MHRIFHYHFLSVIPLCFALIFSLARAETAAPADLVTPWTGFSSAHRSAGAVLPLPDGRILVGGASSAGTMRLFDGNGVEDLAFVSPVDGQVVQMAIGPFGKIYVIGGFNSSPIVPNYLFVRLNANLSLDASFDPPVPSAFPTSVYPLRDGAVFLTGSFFSVGEQTTGVSGIYKVTHDGELDASFQSPFNSVVKDLVAQPDGKFIAVGSFTQPSPNIARFDSDGIPDSSFVADSQADDALQIELAPDGKFYLTTAPVSSLVQAIKRFLPNGNVDPTFDVSVGTNFINPRIRKIALERDGQIVVVGDFGEIAGVARNRIARLNVDGTVDALFDPGAGFNRAPLHLAIDPLGKIILGSDFISYDGTSVIGLAALGGDCLSIGIAIPPAEIVSNVTGSVTFNVTAISANGAGITYQWRKDGVPIPGETSASLTISPVAKTDAANYDVVVTNSVTSETVTSDIAPLIVLAEPQVVDLSSDLDVEVYQQLTLEVEATGATPLMYQWQKDGMNIPGATSRTYQVENAMLTDAGSYSVVVSNFVDQVTSDPVLVSVSEHTGPASVVTGFDGLDFTGTVSAILPLPDGRTLIGGVFASAGGVPVGSLAVINAERTAVDASFDLGLNQRGVTDLIFDSENRIVVSLRSPMADGSALIRLNPDLSVDPSFSGGPAFSSSIFSLLAGWNGAIFVGGRFEAVNGDATFAYLCKVDGSGTLDPVFRADLNGSVYDLLLDGEAVIAAGNFTLPIRYLTRLDRKFGEQEVESSFLTSSGRNLFTLERSTDESFWAAGQRYLRRYLGTGETDGTFPTIININVIRDLSLLRNGKLLVGWSPSTVSGFLAQRFARLNADGGVDTTFDVGEGFRSGMSSASSSGPSELPAWVDVIRQTPLGEIWVGGEFQTYRRKPQQCLTLLKGDAYDLGFSQQPRGVELDLGGTAEFSVQAVAGDTASISYQWFKDGMMLNGETGASMTLANVSSGDEGSYSVRLTNDVTMSTLFSEPALLTVVSDVEILRLTSAQDLVRGDYLLVRVAAQGSGNLTYQWRFNGVDIPGATQPLFEKPLAVVSDSGIYTVAVTNSLGTVVSEEIPVSVIVEPGDVWLDVLPSTFSHEVYDNLVLPNGKILIAGRFVRATHPDNNFLQPNLVLLNADGSPDTSFQLSINGAVVKLGLDQSNRVLLFGNYSTIDGVSRNRFARLNADLSLDLSFVPDFPFSAGDNCQAIQADSSGRVYLGGIFRSPPAPFTGELALIRLNVNGSTDTSPQPEIRGFVTAIQETGDGKILCSGSIGQPVSYLARFLSDGTLDTGFTDPVDRSVDLMTQLSDGRLVVVDRVGKTYFLSADGAVERELQFTSAAETVSVDSQDRVLVGGRFFGVEGYQSQHIARLLPDGTVDRTFQGSRDFSSSINSISILNDGKIAVTGDFFESPYRNFAILNGGPVDPYLTWASGQGISGSEFSPFSDSDGDGWSNLVEFAYQLDLQQLDSSFSLTQSSLLETGANISSSFPDAPVQAAGNYYLFSVLMPEATDGLNVSLSASADLSFTDEVNVLRLGATPHSPGLEEVHFMFAQPISQISEGVFYRVNIEKTLR